MQQMGDKLFKEELQDKQFKFREQCWVSGDESDSQESKPDRWIKERKHIPSWTREIKSPEVKNSYSLLYLPYSFVCYIDFRCQKMEKNPKR